MAVTAQTVSISPQPDGTTICHFVYTDSTGAKYDLVPCLPAGVDPTTWRDARIPEIEESLAAQEFNELIGNG